VPSLKNIWRNPDAELVSDTPLDTPGVRQAEVRIRGLLCYLCSVRVGLFFEALPFVKDISFHPQDDRFVVTYEGSECRFEELRKAVNNAVIGRKARVWLESVGPYADGEAQPPENSCPIG